MPRTIKKVKPDRDEIKAWLACYHWNRIKTRERAKADDEWFVDNIIEAVQPAKKKKQ